MDKDYYMEFEDSDQKIVLPSEEKKGRRREKRQRKPMELGQYKLYVIILILILLYFSYNQLILLFLNLMSSHPTLYAAYLYLESQISNSTSIGLFTVAVLGSLFFLSLPSELLFIYYLNSAPQNVFVIFGLMLAGNLVGLVFNYLFGWLLGERVLRFFFRKNFDKYQERVLKYGGVVLFFGNILPGPIELLSIFYGGFKYRFSYYVYLCLAGRAFKYMILFVIYVLYWDQLVSYYYAFLDSFLVLRELYM